MYRHEKCSNTITSMPNLREDLTNFTFDIVITEFNKKRKKLAMVSDSRIRLSF